MATASIRSWVTTPAVKPTITDASRDDLAIDDEVQLASVNTGTAYQWSIAFKPQKADGTPSSAVFSSTGTEQAITQNPGSFTVDTDGPYLIRLAFTDGTGTTEQYVRLRAKTAFGSLKLVAAGERYDTLRVPVDVTASGWADEQNYNLNTLLDLVKATTSLGNVLYVDAAGGGDYTTVQEALDHAQGATPPPSVSSQWVVLVRPGTYVEDLTFFPFVNVLGWPGGSGPHVVNLTADTAAGHTFTSTAANHTILLADLALSQPTASSPVLTQGGPGNLYGSRITLDGNYAVLGTCGSTLVDSKVIGNGIAPGDFALTVAPSTDLSMERCVVEGNSGISLGIDSTAQLDDCAVKVSGTTAISSAASDLYLTLCEVNGPIVAAGATVGDMSVGINHSYVTTVSIDGALVGGVASLNMGVTAHGALSAVNGAVLTASAPADTVFYDNAVFGHAIPLTASNVQDALDEIYDYASQVRTLDDAYDGGIPNSGVGRTILADQGAVQIVDIPGGSVPIPPGNTSGSLEVVGPIKVGAILDPEMTLDPNMWGNGPMMKMGYDIWAGDAPHGSTGLILGDAVSGRNYNLRLATSSTDGGTKIGSLALRGGDSLAAIEAGHIFVQAGTATDGGGGNGGTIFVAPGASAGGNGGTIKLADPSVATAATLTAGGAFVGGVTGNITFGTELGGFTIAVDAADAVADVRNKFDATGAVTASGDPIVLTTVGKGPTAEIFYLNADAGVDAALGGFSLSAIPAPVFVAGSWPSTIDIVVSAANEISFGPTGATGPMIYNADTGKLTVPGVIDPTAMVFDEAGTPATGAAKGAIFVSDGSVGVQNHLYYVDSAGATTDLTAGGGGGGDVTGPASATDDALARFDGTTGKLLQNSNATLTDAGGLTLAGNLELIKAAAADSYVLIDRLNDTVSSAVTHTTAASADWVTGTPGGSSDYTIADGVGNERLKVDATGVVTFNSAFTLPNADGGANQVLQTDGAGTVSWAPAGSMSSFIISDTAGAPNTSTITNGDTLTFANTAGETTVGVSGDNVTIGLPATGVAAGNYVSPVITVDVNGRITSALTAPGLQGAYDYGNTIVTAGPTDIAFTLSAAGGGFTVNGDGNVLIGVSTPIGTFSMNSTANATMSSQDEIDIIVNATDAADKVLDLSATNAGAGGASIRLTADTTNIVASTYSGTGAVAGTGIIHVADGTAVPAQEAGSIYYGDPNGVQRRLNAFSLDRHHINMPEAPGNTVEYKGWATGDPTIPAGRTVCILKSVKVLCVIANTQGSLNLSITNNATGNSVLNVPSLNINSTLAASSGVLADDIIYTATLTAIAADLAFAEDDRWTISLQSTDPAMDAVGIYIDLTFEVI